MRNALISTLTFLYIRTRWRWLWNCAVRGHKGRSAAQVQRMEAEQGLR